MLKIFAFISSLLVPLAAFGQSAAVIPVSYKIYRTAAQSAERAAKVEAAVVRTVERLDMTVVTGAAVEAALNDASPSGAAGCLEDACLDAVAEKSGADVSVAVSVVDNDGQFDIKVAVSGVETGSASPFGTFNAMVRRVVGMVESSLREAKERMAAAAAPPPAEESTKGTTTADEKNEEPEMIFSPEPAPPAPDDTVNRRKKPVSKVAFFTTLGVTVGIGAAFAAVTAIGSSKWNSYKEGGEWTPDDEAQLDNLQLSSRILLGALGAGVIATVVLAPLTKFGKTDKKVAVVPSFTGRTGGVLLQGEF